MGSLISQPQLDTVTAARRGRRRQGRPRAGRRPGPTRHRPVLLRAHRARRRLGRHGVLRRRDLRPGRLALPLRHRRRGRRVGQRHRVRAQRRVWTRDAARGRRSPAASRGTVNVNEAYGSTYGSLGAPMGGMKDSGLGRRHGAEGILRYTEAQTVATQRLLPIAPLLGMSEETYAQGDDRGAAAAEQAGASPEMADARGHHYDVLVIGSGFGGSVTALRLTEKGYRVGVLEAGRRFADDELPEDLLATPATSSGPRRSACTASSASTCWATCMILAGAGVGGGSLDYANTLYVPPSRSSRTRSGRTSPTGRPSSRRTTTRPSGCSASARTRP